MPSEKSELHDRLLAAMRSPSFYPHDPAECEMVETHISWVFLAGDRAYKLRKPVTFPFLDYGTAERRRAFCEEELRLGRRFAPSIYLGVRAVIERDGAFSLAEPGSAGAVEHVTEMRRIDPERTLEALLAGDEVGEAEVARIARRIAALHAEGEGAAPGTFGARAVAETVSENFTTLLPRAAAIGERRLAAADRFAAAFLHGRRALLERRSAEGHVREGHGDLRAEHVIVGKEIEVFDPVEFDPALRYVDVLADVAFLVMDLARAGREDLAHHLVDDYRQAAGDTGGEQLVWFYAAYRAWVRAKVACLRAEELGTDPAAEHRLAEARSHADLAERLAWHARRPLVLVVCGGSATGKSHLSQALAERSGLEHLNSDVVRKELAGLAPQERAPESAYSTESSLRTYAELGERAACARSGAIVDATFRHRREREAFLESYGDQGPEPIFVECRAPAGTVSERAQLRTRDPERVSDADPDLSVEMLGDFEPLDEVPASMHIALRTDAPDTDVIDELEAALDRRLAGARP